MSSALVRRTHESSTASSSSVAPPFPHPSSGVSSSAQNPVLSGTKGITETPSPKGKENASLTGDSDSSVSAPRSAVPCLWEVAGWLHRNSELPSVSCCRRGLVSTEKHARVNCSHTGRARVAALKTCGSVWACPHCSLRTWHKRSLQLSALLAAVAAEGHCCSFLTLTMRHTREQALTALWDALSASWHRLNNDRTVKALRLSMGWTGSIRRVEVTDGENGWHVHAHVLETWERSFAVGDRLLDGVSGPRDFEQTYEAACFGSWSSGLALSGMAAPRRGVGTDLRMLDLSNAPDAVAKYVTARSRVSESMALELTDAVGGKVAKRGNRSPWQVLSAAMAGDGLSFARWREWETGSKGRRALLFSAKIRDRYAVNLDEPDIDSPDEFETELVLLEEVRWVELLEVGNPGVMLREIETAYASLTEDATVWERLSAGQDAALNYLAGLGIDDGLIVVELGSEQAFYELHLASRHALAREASAVAEISPGKPQETTQGQLFEVGQKSAIRL